MRNVIIPHGFQAHYTIGFANGLAENDVDLTIIMDTLEHKQLNPTIQRKNLKAANDPSRNKLRQLFDYIGYHIRLIIFILRNHGALIHISGMMRYPILMGIFENILFRILSKHLILTVHNILPHNKHTKLNTLLYRAIYKIPQHLIVHTTKMKQELLQSYNVPEFRILVMEHGINAIETNGELASGDSRSALGIPADKTILLIFGHISPYKGIETLLDAFDKLDDNYYLVIAGMAADKAYENKITNRIKSNANFPNIVFHNKFVSDDEIAMYFKASNVLILPYKHIDQSGIVFLSMSMGLPMIAFDVGSLSQYICNDIGIVVYQKDAEGLKQAIHTFKTNISSYSPDKIKHHAKRYQWNQVVAPVLSLYQS